MKTWKVTGRKRDTHTHNNNNNKKAARNFVH